MRLVQRVDYDPFNPAQLIKLSRIASLSTSIVRRVCTLAEMMASLVNFTLAFHKDYGADFIDAKIKDIVAELISASFLGGSSKGTYICYVRICKMLMREKGVLRLFQSLSENMRPSKC